MTIIAHKGKEGPCIDKGQSVIYKGPFKHIEDDDDHILSVEKEPLYVKRPLIYYNKILIKVYLNLSMKMKKQLI